MIAAQRLLDLLGDPQSASPDRPAVSVFLGETAPESLTGPIKEFRPTCLIILDAMNTNSEPGSIRIINPAQIDDSAGTSTHSMPFKVLTAYLGQSLKCEFLIVGIQPESLEFGRPPSKAVVKAAKSVASAIADSLAGG
jgi:hydrogenase maturation protease